MGAAGQRVGYPGEVSGQGAGHLKVDSGGVVFSGVEFGLVAPGPTGHEGAIDDQLGVGAKVIGSGDVLGQGDGNQGCQADRTRETVGWEMSNSSARVSCSRLCRRLARTSRML